MKYSKTIYIAFTIVLSFGVISCKDGTNTSSPNESDLIAKINAVQEQIMVQGNITAEEEQAISSLCSIMTKDDGLANHSPEDRMVLKDVDVTPVYSGCEGQLGKPLRTCFNEKIEAFIKNEFDINIVKDLNLPQEKEVEAFFIIDENGAPSGFKIRNAEVTIQAEILRIFRNIPKMKPALHNGKNVAVLCSIVVKYGNTITVESVYIPEYPEDENKEFVN